MIWFIADTHFGHESIIDLCGRPFKDAGDMETFMIKAWNERVRGDDTVFILGDMFFKHKDPERVMKLLKGKKTPYCRKSRRHMDRQSRTCKIFYCCRAVCGIFGRQA